MARVTGFTAERMLEIEGTTIIGGIINEGGHLILTRRDGFTIDAGEVKGTKGDPGSGVYDVEITYQAGVSGTVEPTGEWTTNVPIVHVGQYLWVKTLTTYADPDDPDISFTTTTFTVTRQPEKGSDGRGITGQNVQYQEGNSGVTAPTGGWLGSVPPVAPGKFLWTKTITTYTDSSTNTAYSVAKQGSDGTAGEDGSDGRTQYLHVAYASSADGVEDFSTTDPAGRSYMGTATTFTEPDPTDPSVYGWSLIRGASGTGISSGSVRYQASTSGTITPVGTWLVEVPHVSEGEFLWSRSITNFTDGASQTVYSVSKQGERGQDGSDGRGITSIVEEYYLSDSSTTRTGGTWSTTRPDWAAGKYFWTRSTINYTSGNPTTTDPICVSGESGSSGSDGRSIVDVDVYYYLSNSSTSLIGGSWSTTSPEWVDGKYMWSKTVTTYSSGDPTESTPVCITGSAGQKGDDGAPGDDGISVSELTRYYYLGTSELSVPTVSPPPAPWMPTEPAYTPGSSESLYEVTRTVMSDGAWSYGPVSVSAAFTAAKQAWGAAANAQTTADGKNARRRGVTEPEPPGGGWVQGDQWLRDNDQGVPVELLVWNGGSFATETILTGELLVIGGDGTVRLSEGTVTAESIAAGALDFVVARGAQFYGGYIEAPVIASSDRLGSGANVLNDPTFLSTVNTAWVASGHLGDAAVTQTDTHTWDQTVNKLDLSGNPNGTKRYLGSGASVMRLTPATRACGSLLFANYSWFPTASRSYNNPITYKNPEKWDEGSVTGKSYSVEWASSKVPTLTAGTARTTYLTNTAVADVVAGERWNVRAAFSKIGSDAQSYVNLRVELINSVTSAVVWFHDVLTEEKTAGAINKWFEPTANASLKLRIRAVYTAAGGKAQRKMNTSARARIFAKGVVLTDWSPTTADGFHAYGSYPSTEYLPGTGGQPPTAMKVRAELNVTMQSAVFAKVEPQQGWRLTEEKGLELFNSLGAQTGRVDGGDNFLAGRFATRDSGERWEVQGERVVFINASELEVGGLRKSGSSIELFGNFKFQDDTDWVSVAIASGASGYAHWCRYQGIIHLRFNITTTTAVASNAAYTPAFTLPAAALADLSTSGLESFAATVGGSGAATGIMNTSGTVTLKNLHTTAQSNFRGTAKWKPKP